MKQVKLFIIRITLKSYIVFCITAQIKHLIDIAGALEHILGYFQGEAKSQSSNNRIHIETVTPNAKIRVLEIESNKLIKGMTIECLISIIINQIINN